jgi:sulfur-oxidizing protein SoxZ
VAAVPDPIRIRARLKEGTTEVHVLMPHPMETGLRLDSTGRVAPPHFITEVQIHIAGRPVLTARFGRGVSADPLLHFRFKGASPGDRISVAWVDNLGERRTDETAILAA